jgi:hypothetical protein
LFRRPQLVLKLLGDTAAEKALETLLAQHADAAAHVAAYQRELEHGTFQVVSRFQPEQPQQPKTQ